MFCIHCGRQLPDDARFCSACGKSTAQQTPARPAARTTAATQPRPAAPTAPKNAPSAQSNPQNNTQNNSRNNAQTAKKGTNPLVLILIFVCIYFVAYSLTRKQDAPAVSGDSTSSTIAITTFSAASGETFDQILPAGYLADKYKFQTSGYAAYVKENSDGMIYLHEYGYEGDLVKEFSITTIMPTPGWSTSDIGGFLIEADRLLEELMAEHSFITGESKIVGEYEYVAVEVHMKDLDREANVQAAVEEELILVENNAKLISMSQTENSLRTAGYAKK